MPLPIITAAQRAKERTGVKLAMFGPFGVGKTWQLNTLPLDSTLFIDVEAGDLAVKDWAGDTLRPKSWTEFRDIACYLGGANVALPPEAPFSEAHFRHVCDVYGDPEQLAKYDTYFVDSLTVLSRWCLAWAKTQPAAFSERTGKPDMRGAYGLLAAELLGTLTHLQHARGKHVIYVAILDEKTDEFNRRYWSPQIEGGKTATELPGIVDEVVTLAQVPGEDGTLFRAFVAHNGNPYGFPAKDRSGALDLLEPPDLGALIAKCAAKHRNPEQQDTAQA